jgi:hypothetical protein
MTAQTPDRIVIDGEEHELLATPLDRLLGQLPNVPELVAPHTANWRGYVARWRVADGQLVLDDVRGWVGEDRIEVGPAAVIPGVDLPRVASWVTDTLRVGVGEQVRHIHAGFESRYERELLLDVDRGAVTAVRELAQTGRMGNAGPYLLEEPLLGDLSGGGFGQLIAARDLDGHPLVAKAPRPTGGSMSGTEVRAGDVPIHVPAKAYVRQGDAWVNAPVGPDVTAAILRAEAEILERDRGALLPRSLGIWDHESSGSIVLVMERLDGRSPATAAEVRAVLAAVADAVDRGIFDAHGDLKREHVFIDDRVRICDPAPRFDDASLHAFTPAYNPRGLRGAAADVAACASMLRYLPAGPGAASQWAADVLDADNPPDWAADHRAALARLDEALAQGEALPPGDATWPPPSDAISVEVWSPPDPLAGGPPLGPGWPQAPPVAFDGGGPTEGVRTIQASVDRIIVAAVDIILGGNLSDHPDVSPPADDVVEADADAVLAALASLLSGADIAESRETGTIEWTVVGRLFEWARRAFTDLAMLGGFDHTRIDLRMPNSVRGPVLRDVLEHTAGAYVENQRAVASSTSDAEQWSIDTWWALTADERATPLDLVWTAALLTAELARLRRDEDHDAAGGLAMVLDGIGSHLFGGFLAWEHPAGTVVQRPRRYGLRTLFDPGSGALIWQSSKSALDRWDYWLDHFDLPIPLRLAARVQHLVVRYDLAFEGIGPDDVPWGPGEAEQFARDYHAVCGDLERALGSAYSIDKRSEP